MGHSFAGRKFVRLPVADSIARQIGKPFVTLTAEHDNEPVLPPDAKELRDGIKAKIWNAMRKENEV